MKKKIDTKKSIKSNTSNKNKSLKSNKSTSLLDKSKSFIKNSYFVKSFSKKNYDINFLMALFLDFVYYAIFVVSTLIFVKVIFFPNFGILRNANSLMQQISSRGTEAMLPSITQIESSYQMVLISLIIFLIVIALNYIILKLYVINKLIGGKKLQIKTCEIFQWHHAIITKRI